MAFVASFVFFQYTRERDYREELMSTRLQDFNNGLYIHLKQTPDSSIEKNLKLIEKFTQGYCGFHYIDSLRVTIIREDGSVIYDNFEKDVRKMTNHANRAEVRLAIKEGNGSSINRTSETLTSNFFYDATYYNKEHIIIRSALPYDVTLSNALKIDPMFIYFAVVLSLLLYFIFYRYTRNMGNYIAQLRSFVKKADHNEQVEPEEISVFPDNDLGEISQHIIRIYKNLTITKEQVSIEREKLISHLRISREGLCIFDRANKCIFANSLFTQYSSLIADIPLQHNERVLDLPEFKPVIDLLNQPIKNNEFEPKKKFEIEKGGRIYDVECVLFQDFSYEISICDITQDVEQARLKHQLTQNIAHELKTPISSIQGYLETITNSDLPVETQKQFISRCYAQSNRLVNLLRDITMLTRMDEASKMIDKEAVDISVIMQNIQRETALQIEEKKMRVNNLLPTKLEMEGNGSLIYSIFRNLTDNSIAYAGEGSTITIRCFREDEEYLYFSFSDDGVGVGNEHLNRLFERFYRVDKGRSRKMGGTGLGLAIVKNAVIFHGGNITAKNAQDGGLEFVFSLHK